MAVGIGQRSHAFRSPEDGVVFSRPWDCVLIMARLWSIADLIDLHYFFQLDDEVRQRDGEAALVKRDRLIYLAKIEPQLGQVEEVPARLLVRKWLTMRRLQFRREPGHVGTPLPGTVWRELSLLAHTLMLVSGLIAGAGLAGSLLLYSGTTPLNVSVYFGLFVALQVAVLGLQAALYGLRRLRRLDLASSAFYPLVGRLLMRVLDAVRRWGQRSMTGSRRLDLATIAGSIRQRQELAVLLVWPGFMLLQVGGIGFNLGAIAATLAKVTFSDIAFAWQSSLQLSVEAVADLVRWIALPWSWLAPQTVPSIEQIQGSQMVLKEGIAHLATADLLSWWPFLVCAVLTYGLLPRCLLLVLGIVRQRQALDQLHFATLSIRPLLQRMTAPRIDTQGVPEPAPGAEQRHPASDVLPPTAPISGLGAGAVASGERCMVLVPDELYEDCPQAALAELLQQTGSQTLHWFRYSGSEALGAAPPEELARALAEHTPTTLFMLQEAWQPPLKETEQMLHGLRLLIGQQIPIFLLLIGRPTPQTILTPAEPEQMMVWSRRIQAMGDPHLAVQPVVQP